MIWHCQSNSDAFLTQSQHWVSIVIWNFSLGRSQAFCLSCRWRRWRAAWFGNFATWSDLILFPNSSWVYAMQRICCFITCPPFSVFEVFHRFSQSSDSHSFFKAVVKAFGIEVQVSKPLRHSGPVTCFKTGATRHNPRPLCSTIHVLSMYCPCTTHVLFHIIRLSDYPPQPPSSKPLGQAAVRPAFRKLAAKLHPDIAGTGDAAAFRQVLWVALTCFFFPNQSLNLFQQDVSEVHEVPGHWAPHWFLCSLFHPVSSFYCHILPSFSSSRLRLSMIFPSLFPMFFSGSA